MTQHDDTVALRHMRDHAVEAVALAQGRFRGDLDADRLLALGLTRLVEVIGEAASRVSPRMQEAHPDIPWRQIVGTRNRLIHGYDAVDYDIVWQIVSRELPPLVEQLEVIVNEL